ncbi:MAG: hypothetical protein HRU06_06515 [Oceanospirillaceae bacterium]|nr:hypothetical protein [Oceanospirillaceae bacterium]
MLSWQTYKSLAKQRGALALELYIVESTGSGDGEAIRDTLPAHLEYQRQLERLGQLALAGPVSDLSGEEMQGNGMIIYRAQSLEQARALADGDPMHSTGARNYTLRRWLINEGSLSLNVTLSDQRVDLR